MAPKDKAEDTGVLTAAAGGPSKDTKKEDNTTTAGAGVGVVDDSALSEEDRDLKERLETCVSTLVDMSDPKVTIDLRLRALDLMVTELRTATSSMTSVPKPLKFLRPRYTELRSYYHDFWKPKSPEQLSNEELRLRARLADVLAVLAMTMATSERESLRYKLSSASDYKLLKDVRGVPHGGLDPDDDNLGSWGHEFVRSLAGEIGEEYQARILLEDPATAAAMMDEDEGHKIKDGKHQDLMDMVSKIVPFHVTHNAEAEAIDLLIEVQRLRAYLLDLPQIDANNYHRICLYLIKTADYMSDPDDLTVRFHICVSKPKENQSRRRQPPRLCLSLLAGLPACLPA
jgi:26S proteasome regulatory subunit N1